MTRKPPTLLRGVRWGLSDLQHFFKLHLPHITFGIPSLFIPVHTLTSPIGVTIPPQQPLVLSNEFLSLHASNAPSGGRWGCEGAKASLSLVHLPHIGTAWRSYEPLLMLHAARVERPETGHSTGAARPALRILAASTVIMLGCCLETSLQLTNRPGSCSAQTEASVSSRATFQCPRSALTARFW